MTKAFTYSDNDKLVTLLDKAFYYFLDMDKVWGLTEKEIRDMLNLIEQLTPILKKVTEK